MQTRFLASVAILFAACTARINLYPVEGPLSEKKPLPVLRAVARGITGNSGPITMSLPGGIACNGRWSSAAGAGITTGGLIGTHGSTVGVAVSTGTGQNPGQAVLVCDDGTTIEVEYITGAGTANGFGVAKDTNGNLYRVLF
jgi:hypothetical protein